MKLDNINANININRNILDHEINKIHQIETVTKRSLCGCTSTYIYPFCTNQFSPGICFESCACYKQKTIKKQCNNHQNKLNESNDKILSNT